MTPAMKANPESAPVKPPPVANGGDRRARQKREVDANYKAFKARFDELYREHPGKYALMRDREVVAFFSGFNDAMTAGRLLYGNGVFSVQHVTLNKLDLGYWNHALLHAPR